jgi:superfamily I DNA/RNA helicase
VDPLRHFYQQGRARDEGAGRASGRPGGGRRPWLGTFHAIAAKLLRRHAELVGLQSNYTIIDTDDRCGFSSNGQARLDDNVGRPSCWRSH